MSKVSKEGMGRPVLPDGKHARNVGIHVRFVLSRCKMMYRHQCKGNYFLKIAKSGQGRRGGSGGKFGRTGGRGVPGCRIAHATLHDRKDAQSLQNHPQPPQLGGGTALSVIRIPGFETLLLHLVCPAQISLYAC